MGAPLNSAAGETGGHARSVLHAGALTLVASIGAIAYALATPGGSNRQLVLYVAAANLIVGIVVVACARRIARSSRRRLFMLVLSLVQPAMVAVTAIADGGAASPLAQGYTGMLALMASSSPPRVVAPLTSYVIGMYLVTAAAGDPTRPGWVAMTTFAMLVVTAACTAQAQIVARQRGALAGLARTDSLTEVLNRRGFDDSIGRLARRAIHDAAPLSLVICDLDGFKELNDTLGHQAGDERLRWIATTLSEALRAQDVVARIGGDEFALLLPGVDGGTAAATVARLHATVADHAPASFGAATLPDDGGDPIELMRCADVRLYAAKASPLAPVASAQ